MYTKKIGNLKAVEIMCYSRVIQMYTGIVTVMRPLAKFY